MILKYVKEYKEFWYKNGDDRRLFKNISSIYWHFKLKNKNSGY